MIAPAQSGQVQSPQDREAAKLAAQRAFFAVLGKTEASREAPGTAAAAAAQAAPATTSASSAMAQSVRPTEAPAKVLRPGSIIDIRV